MENEEDLYYASQQLTLRADRCSSEVAAADLHEKSATKLLKVLTVDPRHVNAQCSLGWMYDQGRGVAQSDEKAVAWYSKAAEQNDAKAQCNLGRMYEQGRGVAQSDEQAVVLYKKAAEQNNAAAQHSLGIMYEQGRGVA